MLSYMQLGLVVQEMFKEKVYARITEKTDHNSSPGAFGSGEVKRVENFEIIMHPVCSLG